DLIRQGHDHHDEPDDVKDWDPTKILNNLSFLEKKIHQLQDLVHLISGRRRRGGYTVRDSKDEILIQQQQLITADLTSVIVQLISTAGSLLPSARHHLPSGIVSNEKSKVEEDQSEPLPLPLQGEDHEMRSDDDADDGESLPPGSYEILQLEKDEILAPHTHFCGICGKGFKRDANLRMHMRGHGDEYKTPEALAKPNKESSEPVLIKRYSCPYVGCKRNKDHKKFQPLKTILCVKNHFKRTHCDKNYTCSRCNAKKFSVVADLKTHEKHCGRDKWLCSCGTTFSRKDKLFGHIGLFQGHSPAIPSEDARGNDHPEYGEAAAAKVEQPDSGFDVENNNGGGDDHHHHHHHHQGRFFPAPCFDASSSGGYREFPRPPNFDDCESSLAFLVSGPCEYLPKDRKYDGDTSME
ncbi:hypothetical protein M569_07711, partial [Genlisea aurea]